MSETNDQDAAKGRLSLRPAGRMELGRTVDAGSVRQSFSHGRSKVVQVEVRKKRAPITPPPATSGPPPSSPGVNLAAPPSPTPSARGPAPAGRSAAGAGRALTATELAARQRAVADQVRDNAKRDAE